MNNWILVAAACLAIAVVATIGRYLYNKTKSHRGITKSIGAIPEPKPVLYAESYWKCYREKQSGAEKIDDHTWQNLDMDTVFQRLNSCLTEAGDIFLYKRLRGMTGEAGVARQESIIEAFDNQGLLQRSMYSLKRIGRGHHHTIKTITLEPESLTENWKWLVFTLALLPLAVLLCYLITAAAPFLVMLVVSLAANFILNYIFKARIVSYRVAYPLLVLLYWAKKLSGHLEKDLPQLAGEISKCLAVCKKTNLPFSFMRFSDFCEQVGMPDFTSPFLLPVVSYYRLASFIQKETASINELVSLVGEVDAACAVYSFRKSIPRWATPTYTAERKITATDIYHPLLDEPVANNIDTGRPVLLTGSNASGKSTFLKTIAVNLIMAQSVNTCCAGSLLLKRANVLTAMAVSDSIIDGESYFIAEISAMKRLVDKAGEKSFSYMFIDEILRGTNTVERIAAASAFLDFFNRDNVLCFAATHDIELVSITAPSFTQYHFTEQYENGEIVFSYRLQPGPANTRNALKLLEAKRFPAAITTAADEAIHTFETTGGWLQK